MMFLYIAGLAFFTALAVTGFMVSAGLGDVADHRSAHSQTIPTGGGLGFVAGLGVAAIAFAFADVSTPLHRSFAQILSLIFAVSMLGLVDDVLTLSARMKFSLLLIICGAAVYLIGPVTELRFGEQRQELPYLIGFFGSLLWIFVVANAVNFMDGANGFMGTAMVIASLGLFGLCLISGAPNAAVLSIINFAVLLGFLPYNQRRKALIFSGDVGALFVGFTYGAAVLMLLAEAQSSKMLYAGPILILPFLTDVFMTLIRRFRRKENLLTAHNMHLYQRLIRAGWSHLKVTWLYGFTGLLLANAVLINAHWDMIDFSSLLPLLAGMLIAGYYMASQNLPD